MKLREYQEDACGKVQEGWSRGKRSVLLVAPTGSGKTVMGANLVGDGVTLWVAHRVELVDQAARQLGKMFGRDNVGRIRPGVAPSPDARIQVATIQTLLARGVPSHVDMVVLDEAHHYMAPEFRAIVDAFPGARFLGLTATPQRATGEPLGDIFEELVVAAHYQQLITSGDLVDVEILRPPEDLGSDLAMDPLDAWMKYADGRRTFGFFSRVEHADEMTRRLKRRGIRAETIEAGTNKRWRENAIALFRSGQITVLNTVWALTEGVDVPDAEVALSCQPMRHVSTMLQAFGRVMRPSEGKSTALLLDLCGATHRHGSPTMDREYSLDGKAISTDAPREAADEREVSPFVQNVLGLDLERVVPRGAERRESEEPRRVVVDMTKLRRLSKRHGLRAAKTAAEYQERIGD